MASIWIFAGGTGGHISPGISLADSFLKKKHSVTFFTLTKNTSYANIQRLIKEKKIDVKEYEAHPIPKNISSLFRFMRSFGKSFLIFSKVKKQKAPDAVICMGGYPCLLPLAWSILNGLPYYLCEQNAVLGRITKMFARKAQAVFLSFPTDHARENFLVLGNPIRKELIFSPRHTDAGQMQVKKARQTATLKNILMMGGSQGASDINRLYLELKKNPFFQNIHFTVMTGKNDYASLKSRARPKDQIVPFIEDMRASLEHSDCVIARSGSGTIFEILSSRKPAVLIPYPHATRDHQAENARYLEKNGLAKLVDVRPFRVDVASKEVLTILKNDLSAIRENLFGHELPLDAHESIPRHIEKQCF